MNNPSIFMWSLQRGLQPRLLNSITHLHFSHSSRHQLQRLSLGNQAWSVPPIRSAIRHPVEARENLSLSNRRGIVCDSLPLLPSRGKGGPAQRVETQGYSTAASPGEGRSLGTDGGVEAEEKFSDKMADGGNHHHQKSDDDEVKYPAVDTYGPVTVKGCDLKPGKKMKWCTCGLSKKAPWCDGAHKKTGFRSLKWEVPENPQSIYQICNCKYTKSPPFCDGTHTNLPEEVLERQKNCANKPNHEECLKMCTGCGWKVDF